MLAEFQEADYELGSLQSTQRAGQPVVTLMKSDSC